jgi:hypothetical protein
MGVSFATTLPENTLISSLHSGLALLRYHSPAIAAAIETDSTGKRVWTYNALKHDSEAAAWARETLKVQRSDLHYDDILPLIHQTKLPYILESKARQFFALHLVLRNSGTHYLLIHGTHAIFDANPTLKALSFLFDHITNGNKNVAIPWGSEWVNLPADIISGSGGPNGKTTYDVPPEVASVGGVSKVSSSLFQRDSKGPDQHSIAS